LLILLQTSLYGAGLTPDSAQYLSTARNLIAGQGWVQFQSAPYVSWPPLFPGLLALLGAATGADPLLLSRYLNAVIFSLLIFYFGRFLLEFSRSPALATLGALLTLLAVPVERSACFAWSEPLFILLLLLGWRQLSRFLADGKSTTLLLAAVFAGLAGLTRYLGVTLVLAGVALLAIQPATAWRKRLGRGLGFAALGWLPLGGWLLRNYLVTGTLTGKRYPSALSLLHNLKQTAVLLSHWFLPAGVPQFLRISALALLLLAAAGIELAPFFRQRQNPSLPPCHLATLPPSFAGLVLAGVYLGVLIVLTAWVGSDPIDDRLLAPVYLPLAFLVAHAFWNLPQLFPRISARFPARPVLLAAGCLWLVYPGWRTLQWTELQLELGAGGYASRAWQESETIVWLRNHSLDRELFSNDPAALYLLTERSAQPSPQKYALNSRARLPDPLPAFAQKSRGGCLVWFKRASGLYSPLPELESAVPLTPVREFADGAIYAIGPGP